MNLPLTTPCAHNFCKLCLESVFTGKSAVRKRYFCEGRSLRAQKAIMKCPLCTMDLSEFLLNPQVNRELMAVIEDLQCQDEEENDEDSSEETESSDKPENMIGVSKDGSDKLDDILEIEGEPKQMNKRLKKRGLDVSGNADGYDFNSDDSVKEMILDVAKNGSDNSDVRFSIFKECLPLPESIFRHAIEENYHGGTKFHQQLSNCQVKKLCALFRPIGGPPMSVIPPPPKHSPPVKFYQNRQPSRLRPPTHPYASTAHHHGHRLPPPPMYGYMPSAAQITNTNPYSCVEIRCRYSCESAPIPSHYPYTRATSDLVL
ncbi:hypothetical protein MKW94_013042 [Papaver nudicaule]|uniref:DCD domain-containing protein n=1 Tax=Papaver nudicaule TaxID=74823 RepID=A0AA41RVQ0_PAPNU|nr:hypothetical protein [Papaver nudicaule]